MAESAQGNITIEFLDPKNPRTGINVISRPLEIGPKSGGDRRKDGMSKLIVAEQSVRTQYGRRQHTKE